MKPVLLDSGVIVASLDRSERHHERVLDLIDSLGAPLVTCEAVIAESCHLLRHLPGAGDVVIENVAAGVFQVPFQLGNSAADVRRIMAKYRDHPIDFADACLIQLANDFATGDILTLDSDFEFFRWGRNHAFHSLIVESE